MSTTIDALRNLGLKVNGEEPQSNYVNNVINEIADNYSPSEAGMSNPMTTAGDIIVGGTSGAPTRLAKGTQGQVLSVGSSGLEWANASGGGGGTQLYKHTIPVTVTMGEDTTTITLEIISASSTAITIPNEASLNTAKYNFDKMAAEAISSRIYIHSGSSDNYYYDMSYPLLNSVSMGTGSGDPNYPNGYWMINNILFADSNEIVQVDGNITAIPAFSDTVTAL